MMSSQVQVHSIHTLFTLIPKFRDKVKDNKYEVTFDKREASSGQRSELAARHRHK